MVVVVSLLRCLSFTTRLSRPTCASRGLHVQFTCPEPHCTASIQFSLDEITRRNKCTSLRSYLLVFLFASFLPITYCKDAITTIQIAKSRCKPNSLYSFTRTPSPCGYTAMLKLRFDLLEHPGDGQEGTKDHPDLAGLVGRCCTPSKEAGVCCAASLREASCDCRRRTHQLGVLNCWSGRWLVDGCHCSVQNRKELVTLCWIGWRELYLRCRPDICVSRCGGRCRDRVRCFASSL